MLGRVPRTGLACLWAALSGCTELCVPTETRLAFFSQGDCVLTKASFFQGHEWLTYFGNQDLDAGERFTDSEVLAIADGNRRVDWPLELLVNLNASPLAYVNSITEYTERPEHQKLHFLLDHVNGSREAVADSVGEIRRLSIEAVEGWSRERERALSRIGRATHVIQDSFSTAHAVRDDDRGDCIVQVKAYIERAEHADNAGVRFHGGREIDTIGHTTTEDSIYEPGRACHEPQGRAAVEACLNASAKRARRATRDYLGFMQRAIALSVSDDVERPAEEVVDQEFGSFDAEHFRLCEDLEER